MRGLMKLKYLIFFAIKKISRNIDINFSLIIVLIIGICGLMVSSEFSNSIKNSNNITIVINTKCESTDNYLVENLINKVKKLDNINKINYEDVLYIETNDNENIYQIRELLNVHNYNFTTEIIYDDGYVSPKLSGILKYFSICTYLLLVFVTQIIFFMITFKIVNLEYNDIALLKCLGYRTYDAMVAVVVQLLLSVIISFIVSVILSFFVINLLMYFLNDYIKITFGFNTIIKQIIILVIEYVLVFIFMRFKIEKINILEIN